MATCSECCARSCPWESSSCAACGGEQALRDVPLVLKMSTSSAPRGGAWAPCASVPTAVSALHGRVANAPRCRAAVSHHQTRDERRRFLPPRRRGLRLGIPRREDRDALASLGPSRGPVFLLDDARPLISRRTGRCGR